MITWIKDLFRKKEKRLQFLFADDFLNMLLVYRAVWIQGRYGGGKTSLAVILAAWLLNSKHVGRVTTNFTCALNTPIDERVGCEDLLYDAALIIDETHAYIADRASVNSYAKYLRKTNYYMLMPSVMPPHMRLTSFSVQRVFNGYVYGIPIWVYKWTLRSANIKEKGFFAILYPDAVFGSYDTKGIPISDGGISDAIDVTIKYEQWVMEMTKLVDKPAEGLKAFYLSQIREGKDPLAQFLKKPGKVVKKNNEKPTGDNQDTLDTLDDLAEEIKSAGEDIEEASKRLVRKVRR